MINQVRRRRKERKKERERETEKKQRKSLEAETSRVYSTIVNTLKPYQTDDHWLSSLRL